MQPNTKKPSLLIAVAAKILLGLICVGVIVVLVDWMLAKWIFSSEVTWPAPTQDVRVGTTSFPAAPPGLIEPFDLASSDHRLRLVLDVLWALEGDDYNIQYPFWKDGCDFWGLDWNYDTYRNSRLHCEFVIFAYWERWCPGAVEERDFDTMVRIYRGGPRGATELRMTTERYALEAIRFIEVRQRVNKGT